MKDLTTWEAICAKKGIDPNALPDLSKLDGISEAFKRYVIAAYKLAIITEVITNDFKPDWNNWNQAKWLGWWNMGSSFGFCVTYFGRTDSRAGAGSRLCCETEEQVLHIKQHFADVMKDLMVKE